MCVSYRRVGAFDTWIADEEVSLARKDAQEKKDSSEGIFWSDWRWCCDPDAIRTRSE
jgi:hypothetical protein